VVATSTCLPTAGTQMRHVLEFPGGAQFLLNLSGGPTTGRELRPRRARPAYSAPGLDDRRRRPVGRQPGPTPASAGQTGGRGLVIGGARARGERPGVRRPKSDRADKVGAERSPGSIRCGGLLPLRLECNPREEIFRVRLLSSSGPPSCAGFSGN
jgi:hypothetical protein